MTRLTVGCVCPTYKRPSLLFDPRLSVEPEYQAC